MEELLDKDVRKRKRNYLFKRSSLAIYSMFFVLLISNLIAFKEIRSIVVSGFAIAIPSVLFLFLSIKTKQKLPTIIFATHILCVLGFIFVINFFNLPPRKAQKPIPFLILIFTAIQIVFLIIHLIKRRKTK